MPNNKETKPKRQRKKKPRTEISSDSDSDASASATKKPQPKLAKETGAATASTNLSKQSILTSQSASNEQVKNAFSQHYMQRITTEFSDDLDKIREADDFKGAESVEVLIRALRQGVDGWTDENMRRVIEH